MQGGGSRVQEEFATSSGPVFKRFLAHSAQLHLQIPVEGLFISHYFLIVFRLSWATLETALYGGELHVLSCS